MNVCFFTDIDLIGGGEVWVLEASRWLGAHGHRASIAAPYGSPLYQESLRQGLDVHGFYRRPGHPFEAPLRFFLERREIDVFYCTLIGRFKEASTLERVVDEVNAGRSRRRLSLVLKTGLPPWTNAVPEIYGFGAGPTVRRLHVVCEATKRAFLDWEPSFPEQFIEVSREGIDLERFHPNKVQRAECRRRWDLPDDAKAIVCAARLTPEKGQRNVLRSARRIVDAGEHAVFLFAGEGHDRPALEGFAEAQGLNGAARFLGQVDDMVSLLGAADVVFHPSLSDSLPNALVEAAAMARPIVASNIEGIPEIVEHGETGLLVEPWDLDGQVDSLSCLLADETRRIEAGRKGRARILRDFNFARNMKRWVENLEAIQAELDRAPTASLTQHLLRTEPLPVLFLMSTLRTGGEETEVSILAEALDRRKFRVLVASTSAVDEPSPATERLREIGIPLDEGCHLLPDVARKVDHLTDFIQANGVRIVVACQDTALAYSVIQRFSPDECRLVEHGGIVEEVGRITKDRTARYVGVSPAIAEAAAGLMPLPKQALTIPSMVDTDRYAWLDQVDLRKHLGLPADDCVVVFVGRLDPKKRIQHLIQAAGAILPTHPKVRFLIVGPHDAYAPEHMEHLLHWSAELRASGRFLFAGPRGDIPQILVASDILVLPSVGEGMSHVINEAGAAGLAVLATDDGAARLQLENGDAGVLVPPDEPARLAQELTRLIGDSERRRRYGSRLRAKVEKDFSKRANLPRWEHLLEEVAEGMSRQPVLPLPAIREDRTQPFPAEIQIQTNTVCNAKCVMCPYPEVSKEFEHGRMDESLYLEILDQCAAEPALWRIEPFLMNEPFTDKRVVDWIALAKKRVPRATVTVTTNGSLLRPKVSDRLIHSGLDAIWFSFNGATKKTYEKIMGISYDTVVRNIDYLLSIKPESLKVFTNMIQTAPMEAEIEENIRNWQRRGVESGPSKLVNRGGNVKNFDELNYTPLGKEATHICDLLYHKMYVLYTGDVVLCCMDWRRQVILGNVRENTLREIWDGEKYWHYRRLHEEGRSEELDLCATCSYVLN